MLSPEDGDGPDAAEKPSAGRAAVASLATSADGPSVGFPWHEISWRGLFSPRSLIWSAVMVIAAVIIYYKSPPPNANHQQARFDDTKPVTAPADGRKSKSETHAAWASREEKSAEPRARALAKTGERLNPDKDKKAIEKLTDARDKLAVDELTRDRSQARDKPQEKPAMKVLPVDSTAQSNALGQLPRRGGYAECACRGGCQERCRQSDRRRRRALCKPNVTWMR